MTKNELRYWIWLSLRCGVGNPSGAVLLSRFGSPGAVYEADPAAIAKALPNSWAIPLALQDKNLDGADRILSYCRRNGVGILTAGSEFYPERLRRIYAYPLVLYCRGQLRDLDDRLLIACVGTRKNTVTGGETAYRVSAEMAEAGAGIVSGLALGIDTQCHKGALSVGGYTIAILGTGIDRAYPPQNRHLMKQIEKTGLVMTEFAPGTKPSRENFPIRNRVISGLSEATVVFEAAEQSGSLITAEYAIRQGRPVFAFPGDIHAEASRGTNSLIRRGATLVTSASDILSDFELCYPTKLFVEKADFSWKEERAESETAEKKEKEEKKIKKEKKPFDREQTEAAEPYSVPAGLAPIPAGILSLLSTPMTSDEIWNALAARGQTLSMGGLLATLTELEIEGHLESLPGGKFRRL
ncbi:MAG: DNA-processing protein DprA [Ruminococcus sp.]|nr:DNA-processing protein DprA [Candidatus Apopatosoma intestinale]